MTSILALGITTTTAMNLEMIISLEMSMSNANSELSATTGVFELLNENGGVEIGMSYSLLTSNPKTELRSGVLTTGNNSYEDHFSTVQAELELKNMVKAYTSLNYKF